MRELQIAVLCDVCWKDEQVKMEASSEHEMIVDRKPFRLELCKGCGDTSLTIEEWEGWFREYGTLPDKKPMKPPKAPVKTELRAVVTTPGGSNETFGPFHCKCGQEFPTLRGRNGHVAQHKRYSGGGEHEATD